MQPRKFATEKQLKRKIKAFNEIRVTTHYPIGFKLFPKKPHTYGKKIPDYSIAIQKHPELTELGKKLAGF